MARPPSPMLLDEHDKPALRDDERRIAEARFRQIVDYFKADRESSDAQYSYSRPLLIKYTYEYARSQASRDYFLRVFFDELGVSLDDSRRVPYRAMRDGFNNFAKHLMDDFFLPIRAAGGNTQLPTPDQLSNLRRACLVRDGYRCVVSRAFDMHEADARGEQYGMHTACDDDGVPLFASPDDNKFELLELAHILPPLGIGTSRSSALRILDMLDHGIGELVESAEIPRPRNSLTLCHNMHAYFGEFGVFFDEAPEHGPNSYTIRSFRPFVSLALGLPVARTLLHFGSADPPSPRLLALHRAIAHILHLSGAGEYIARISHDMEKNVAVEADGSTNLAAMVSLRLGAWQIATPLE